MFTFFEDSSICILHLLNCSFNKLHVFKPSSSKSGNSEVYIICLVFKGLSIIQPIWNDLLTSYKSPHLKVEKSLFDLNEIPHIFLEELSDCVDFFMEKQIETIEENVRNFRKKQNAEMAKIKFRKKLVAEKYIKKYKFQIIAKEKKLVSNVEDLNYLSFYFRQWNYSNKWSFPVDFIEFDTSALTCNHKLCDLLNIKLGKPLVKVVHSNFCSKDNKKLSISDFQSADSCDLEIVESLTSIKDNIIKINDFINKKQEYEFHSSLFSNIREKFTEDQVVLLKIPFTTSFCVAILYLLMFNYEKAIFHKSGYIILQKLGSRMQEVSACFDYVSSAFSALNDCTNDEKLDINQIIPLSVIYDRAFIDLIWNYNNVVCA